MSTRTAVNNAGTFRRTSTARPLQRPDDLFVAGFIGSLSMSLVEEEGVADGFVSERFAVDFGPEAYGVSPGDQVTLGVRREYVYLTENPTL